MAAEWRWREESRRALTAAYLGGRLVWASNPPSLEKVLRDFGALPPLTHEDQEARDAAAADRLQVWLTAMYAQEQRLRGPAEG